MKNVLYIGNALSTKGKTKTTIDTLSEHLKEFCTVKIGSTKPNKMLRILDMVILVLRNFRNTDYVLIDTYSTFNFYYSLLISQLCRILNLRYITILHGGNLESRLINSPKLSRYVFGYAHVLVAPSKYLKTVFEDYGYSEVTHIPNTIDIRKYHYKEREITTIKLFWLRSMASIYNPHLAIEVLENLLHMGYKTQLIMVGPDVDGSLKRLKEYSTQNKLEVTFTGLLPQEQWLIHAQNSNVFINTTNIDNTPVSVYEAMALGLPVVSTNVGGLPFLILDKENGLLVPSDDADAMVHAILNLLKNRDLRINMVRHARKQAESIDWINVMPKWQKLLA